VVVVVGVFIGLQVNNWNQARQDAAAAAQYLHNFDAGLSRTETGLKSNLEFYEKLRENGAVALSLIDKDSLSPSEKSVLYDVLKHAQYVLPADPENLQSYVDKVDQDAIHLDDPGLKQTIAIFGNSMSMENGILSGVTSRLNSYLTISDHYNAVGPILPKERQAELFDRVGARMDPAFRIALAGELDTVTYRSGEMRAELDLVQKTRKRLEATSK
jgi:hypothetical protein